MRSAIPTSRTSCANGSLYSRPLWAPVWIRCHNRSVEITSRMYPFRSEAGTMVFLGWARATDYQRVRKSRHARTWAAFLVTLLLLGGIGVVLPRGAEATLMATAQATAGPTGSAIGPDGVPIRGL